MNRWAQRLLVGLVAFPSPFVMPRQSWAQAKAIATVETNMKATAELFECKRKQGVLTLKVRFKATVSTTIYLPYQDTYVLDVGAGKKYEVLRDSDKVPLATPHAGGDSTQIAEGIRAGETFSVWWKFPAPPPDTRKISFFLGKNEPFEDIPITDVP